MANFLYTLIIYPLYALIECIYVLFLKITDNVGISVMGVSVGITLLCLPLYDVAEKWQKLERDKQSKMFPMLSRIKSTFTGDERYMMTSTYYRECGYNPIMSLRSSFGLLIQIPFFIAAYNFLSHLADIQNCSFWFIKNMGEPDAIFHIGKFSVNFLPIAMTLINVIAGCIYTQNFLFKEKLPIFLMAALFLLILYNSPAGLVLYWTMNNIFSLVKNIFYKLKNPSHVFWICCCVALVGTNIFVFTQSPTAMQNKLLLLAFTLAVFALPALLRFFDWVLHKRLSILMTEKRVRFVVFAISCVLLFVLIGVAIPTTLIASSPIEFTGISTKLDGNPIHFVLVSALQTAGFFLFWTFCVYFLFGEKIQTAISYFMCVIALSAIVNAYGFMLNYGDISPALVFLSTTDFKSFSPISLLNVIVIIVLFLLVAILAKTKKSSLLSSVLFVSVISLFAISFSNVRTIMKHYGEYKRDFSNESASNIEPIFHLSKNKKNVVLLMLDHAQGQFVPDMIKEKSEFSEIYSGFTFYNNALSFNGRTMMGSPGIFGGYDYTPDASNRRADVPLIEKHNQALLLLPRVFSEQAGFTAVMTDPSWPNYKHWCDLSFTYPFPKIKAYRTNGKYFSLWQKSCPDIILDSTGKLLERNLLFFSIFRASPVVFRKIIYKGGNYWNSYEGDFNTKEALDCYSALYFLKDLTSIENTDNGCYMQMENQLTHENQVMLFEAPNYKIPKNNASDEGPSKFHSDCNYHTQMTTFSLIGDWLEFLKKNYIYDNTRIVMVSDHAGSSRDDYFEKDDTLDNMVTGGSYTGRTHYHCLLMFKDFNSKGKLVQNFDDFMTNADVPSLLLNGILEKPINPNTQLPLSLDIKKIKSNGVFITSSDKHQPSHQGQYLYNIKDSEWWHVKDNIFKAENWKQEKPE